MPTRYQVGERKLTRRTFPGMRALYPVTKTWAYFNHAAVSPISSRSVEAIHAWSAEIASNACLGEAVWKSRLENCRRLLAALINAMPTEIAFVPNTTEGVSRVVNGYPWQPGDVVIVPSDEYVSNMLPWRGLEQRGVVVRHFSAARDGVSVDDIRSTVCNATRMVAISAVHFTTGWRADLASIGEFCRSRGIDLCVDAVQAVGVTPVDVRAMHVSFLAAGGHKWLTGPQGTGFLFVAADRWDMLRPSTPGWRSVTDSEIDEPSLLPDARRYESGTSAVGQFLALGEGAHIISELTIDAIGSRVYDMGSYLVDQLQSCGAEVVSRRENDAWSGIIAFHIPDANPHDVRARSLEEGIVLGLRRGLLRASVHFYNSDEDVERLIAALRQFSAHTNASIPRASHRKLTNQ